METDDAAHNELLSNEGADGCVSLTRQHAIINNGNQATTRLQEIPVSFYEHHR